MLTIRCQWFMVCGWTREVVPGDWDAFVEAVASLATHQRTAHDDEPSAQVTERYLLEQAKRFGRAVTEA